MREPHPCTICGGQVTTRSPWTNSGWSPWCALHHSQLAPPPWVPGSLARPIPATYAELEHICELLRYPVADARRALKSGRAKSVPRIRIKRTDGSRRTFVDREAFTAWVRQQTAIRAARAARLDRRAARAAQRQARDERRAARVAARAVGAEKMNAAPDTGAPTAPIFSLAA